VNIGKAVTRGLGAGGVPDNGRRAAEESRAEIMQVTLFCSVVYMVCALCWCLWEYVWKSSSEDTIVFFRLAIPTNSHAASYLFGTACC
jgi:hypothetical protein